ncbi:MAG: YggT family protein [Cellvibrionaceae bacterium]|nr:YggT family protein [Cellvibrionaceae bacterium]
MDKLTQILQLLIHFFFSAYIMIVVVRFLLQVVRADFYNPISQFIVKATNPVLLPLRKIIPGFFGIDLSSLLLALALQMIAFQLLGLVAGLDWFPITSLLIGSLRELISLVLNIYFFSFIIIIVVSWVAPHSHNPAISLISSITEPVLRPIRNVLPSMGGLDFSVMIAMLGIYIIKILIA